MKASPVLINTAWQLAFCLPIAVLLSFIDNTIARSFALGAAVFIIAQAYFVIYAFRYNNVQWAIKATQWGQLGKIILSIFLFTLIFLTVTSRNDVALIAGYSTMVVLQWWISTRVISKHESR